MNKVAFNIGSFPVMWYGVIIAIGVIIALLITSFNCRRKELKISFDNVTDAFLYAFPLAILSARLYFVFFNWSNYSNPMGELLNFRGGGLAIHGGLLGAALGVFIYKIINKKSWRDILDMADAAAPGLVLAQGIGRWGNFINKEAHGSEVSKEFISRFPKFIQEGMFIDGSYYHPTFLYESLWCIVIFILLMILFWNRKKHHKGLVLSTYMILYSLGRYFIESLRTDSLYAGPFRQAQLISIVFALIGLIAIYLIIKRKPEEEISEPQLKEEIKVIEENPLEKVPEELLSTEKVKKVEENIDVIDENIDGKLSSDTKIKEKEIEKISNEPLENVRTPRKAVVKSQGELVEPVVEKKMSLKDKIKASREKSKSRVVTNTEAKEEDRKLEDYRKR